MFPVHSYLIEIDQSIPQVQCPQKQVPVHLKPAYKRKLERLKDLGIITEVGIHTIGQVSCSHTQGRQINTPMP